MAIQWSQEVAFVEKAIDAAVPASPGVYQILQDRRYARYRGHTRILKIGKADTSLRAEICNHFIRHTAANRLARVRAQPGVVVSIVFTSLPQEEVGQTETQLLCDFEDEFWDVPVLNSQRGYSRGTDRHYRG